MLRQVISFSFGVLPSTSRNTAKFLLKAPSNNKPMLHYEGKVVQEFIIIKKALHISFSSYNLLNLLLIPQ